MKTIGAAAHPGLTPVSILGRLASLLGRARAASSRLVPGGGRELLDQLEKLSAERGRLSSLIAEEDDREKELAARVRRIDAERVEALTAARLNNDETLNQRAAELLDQAAATRRASDDCAAVAKNLTARREEVRSEHALLMQRYRHAVAAHLEALFEALIDKYNALAPDIAETVLHIAAVRRVMMDNGIANTNGWSGEVLLPGMRAREGAYVRPILDGASPEFAGSADERRVAVIEELKEAGFKYGVGGAR